MLDTLQIKCVYCEASNLYEFHIKHVKNECPIKPVKCKHCSLEMPREKIEEHEKKICEKAPVTCVECEYTSIRSEAKHNCMEELKKMVRHLKVENKLLKDQVQRCVQVGVEIGEHSQRVSTNSHPSSQPLSISVDLVEKVMQTIELPPAKLRPFIRFVRKDEVCLHERQEETQNLH